MSALLRILLIAASIFYCGWTLYRIYRAQVKIEDAIFWICLSGVLLIMSLFPELVILGTELTGVQSPVNFVFLCMIFILMVKLFHLSMKVSALENKLHELAQRYGIDAFEKEQTRLPRETRESSEGEEK